uniref:Uncharacterized protein n=1 Tax=Arundo donax TaxID=35708 RepID=A0A0A9BZ61_ARUDO
MSDEQLPKPSSVLYLVIIPLQYGV